MFYYNILCMIWTEDTHGDKEIIIRCKSACTLFSVSSCVHVRVLSVLYWRLHATESTASVINPLLLCIDSRNLSMLYLPLLKIVMCTRCVTYRIIIIIDIDWSQQNNWTNGCSCTYNGLIYLPIILYYYLLLSFFPSVILFSCAAAFSSFWSVFFTRQHIIITWFLLTTQYIFTIQYILTPYNVYYII